MVLVLMVKIFRGSRVFMEKDEKNIYTYFKEYNCDLIDCVYNAATSKQARTIFIKK